MKGDLWVFSSFYARHEQFKLSAYVSKMFWGFHKEEKLS